MQPYTIITIRMPIRPNAGVRALTAARASNKFARCPTVQCSCDSSWACCCIILSMRLLQWLGASQASLLLVCFPLSFRSLGSKMITPAVSAAMDVAAVATSIAIFMAASLLPSPASPASWSLLSLPLNLVITSVRQAS